VSELSKGIPGLASATSSRFSLVSYLPTYAAVGYLVVLLAGGAPAQHFEFGRVHDRAAALGGVELAAITLGVVLLAVMLQPLQLPLVQLLEGYWPRWLSRITNAGLARQRAKRTALARQTDTSDLTDDQRTDRAVRQRVLQSAWQLRRRYPPVEHLLPTTLGNALRAMEYDAGSGYGADTVTWWPRLYAVLGHQMRGIVDDRRNQLDVTCRLCATGAVMALISVPLLWRSGWWLALTLVPLAVAIVSYRATVTAAVAYGEAVRAAFDIHRFDLLTLLHLPLPGTAVDELKLNRELTRFWHQGVPMTDSALEHKPSKAAHDE